MHMQFLWVNCQDSLPLFLLFFKMNKLTTCKGWILCILFVSSVEKAPSLISFFLLIHFLTLSLNRLSLSSSVFTKFRENLLGLPKAALNLFRTHTRTHIGISGFRNRPYTGPLAGITCQGLLALDR